MIPTLATLGLSSMASQATLIATDNFDYADGSVAGLSGGSGWNYERTDEPGAPAQSASDWDNAFGDVQIVSSALVTNGNGAVREFGGATEGVGATNEAEGAFRAEGALFFSTTMMVDAMLPDGENQWAGVSSYDFGTERLFFGMPGQNTETRFFGIAADGDVLGTIPVIAGTTYTIVGMLDFDNDLVGLWVNPDGTDNATSYDVSKTYLGTNWSSALRLASGTTTTWDDLNVGTTFADVAPVPEPSTLALAFAATGLLLRRRRSI